MKQENFEKPDTLLRQLSNCQDQLAHMPDDDPSWLDIDTFRSSCGTHRCWLGDYYYRKGLLDKFQRRVNHYVTNDSNKKTFRHVQWAFGSGAPLYSAVFDEDAYGTDARKQALQDHIETLQTKIKAWYSEREILGVMV